MEGGEGGREGGKEGGREGGRKGGKEGEGSELSVHSITPYIITAIWWLSFAVSVQNVGQHVSLLGGVRAVHLLLPCQ